MISQENVEFLIALKHELLTQSSENQGDPVVWGIVENKKQPAYPGCGDDCFVKFDGKTYYSSDIQELKQKIKTEHSKSEYTNNEIDAAADLEELYALILDVCFIGAEINEYDNVMILNDETGSFLTKRACNEYIHNFGDQHDNPKPKAMTAGCNFELKRLLNIVKNTDFVLLRTNKKLEYIQNYVDNEIERLADAPLTDCHTITIIHAAYVAIDELCNCAIAFKEISAADAANCRNKFFNRFASQLEQWETCQA